jgi:hypothetical protein
VYGDVYGIFLDPDYPKTPFYVIIWTNNGLSNGRISVDHVDNIAPYQLDKKSKRKKVLDDILDSE